MDSLCLVANCGRPSRGAQAAWVTPSAPISSRLSITARRNRSSFVRSCLGGLVRHAGNHPGLIGPDLLRHGIGLCRRLDARYRQQAGRRAQRPGHGLRPSGGDLRGRGAAIEGGAARPDSPRRESEHLDAPALCRDLFHGSQDVPCEPSGGLGPGAHDLLAELRGCRAAARGCLVRRPLPGRRCGGARRHRHRALAPHPHHSGASCGGGAQARHRQLIAERL